MKRADFVELTERLRLEVQTDVLAIHPHLCDESGINLLRDIVKPNRFHLVAACGADRQNDSLKDGFARTGIPAADINWKPLDMIGKSTQEIVDSIREALQSEGFDQPTLHNA
jgi:hypothetical protein